MRRRRISTGLDILPEADEPVRRARPVRKVAAGGEEDGAGYLAWRVGCYVCKRMSNTLNADIGSSEPTSGMNSLSRRDFLRATMQVEGEDVNEGGKESIAIRVVLKWHPKIVLESSV